MAELPPNPDQQQTAPPLRTLHIDTERGWRGGEQQALYLMQGLRQRGHAATLVCRAGEPFVERATAAGIAVRTVHPHGEFDPVNAWRLANWLREEPVDVIHAHTSRAHSLAAGALALCPREARPPLVVSRRVDFSIHKMPFRLSGLKYRFLVDRYVAISECVCMVMVDDGIPPEKICVVYSAVDPARYAGVQPAPLRAELSLPAAGPLLVNVAMLVDHKGQRFLLEAMPAVLARHPRARCVIVGDGPLRADLEARARALGVAGCVAFAGFRDDPLACIAAGDVFVMTSHMEGLCTSILDALALGRPVVATRAGGIPEIIDDGANGLLAANRDPASIAAQVCRMLENEPLRARCIAAGRRTITERFSVDGLVEGTLAVYRELTGGVSLSTA